MKIDHARLSRIKLGTGDMTIKKQLYTYENK
ncbi:hypothetical protein Echvi_3765 [Echinicola vietnamensis DSM 17526]|uniref:Uncharacterized protein n=1 Tax=Echinicola vietnamensis (strain DSM 17526 / LMG 23754 / KMM 6221) TaxID=926556 RepID=L0G377_ECHVK|nr:hypothetical protein Echvi_3765 [Echinicola vietnamensis DSM 17526]